MIDVSTECFKSQIDWKVFNFINDYCTRLEDEGIFHTTYVDVCSQDQFGNKNYYNIYNDHGGFYKEEFEYKVQGNFIIVRFKKLS